MYKKRSYPQKKHSINIELVYKRGAEMVTDREQHILSKYTEDVKKVFGKHLRYIILYGSRARGDFREDSDYDIMILTDLDNEEAGKLWHDKLNAIDMEYSERYGYAHHAHGEESGFL